MGGCALFSGASLTISCSEQGNSAPDSTHSASEQVIPGPALPCFAAEQVISVPAQLISKSDLVFPPEI